VLNFPYSFWLEAEDDGMDPPPKPLTVTEAEAKTALELSVEDLLVKMNPDLPCYVWTLELDRRRDRQGSSAFRWPEK
jgi:hypothetical protein